jgi:hypothetical protein
MTFVTPWGLLLAVSAVVPLAAWALLERRARRLRRAIGEPQPHALVLAPVPLALAAVAGLLGLAAAQPVTERTKRYVDLADVQAFVVLDTSGSMAASVAPGAPTRLERARAEALALRRRLPAVRFGIASLTDRVLPHLFPSGNLSLFSATLEQSIGIERPPPSVATLRATSLSALDSLAIRGFYTAPRRVAVVFTDGEADGVTPQVAADLERARIRIVFVQVWRPTERIYTGGVPDPSYRPDRTSGANLRTAARVTGGEALGEGDVSALLSAVRTRLETSGRTVKLTEHDVQQVPLAKWFVLAAALPLAFLLWHRNLRPAGRPGLLRA